MCSQSGAPHVITPVQVTLTGGSQTGVMGSAALAERLDTLAGTGGLVGDPQLANDVRARTGEHEARARALQEAHHLAHHQVLRALHCAGWHLVVSLAPAAFMDAAAGLVRACSPSASSRRGVEGGGEEITSVQPYY